MGMGILWKRNEHGHIIDRKESCFSLETSLEPVVIHFLLEGDDVALLEAELPGVLRLEVVQSLAGGLGQLGGRGAGRIPGRRGHARVEAGAELRGPVRGRAGGRGAGAGGDEGPALHVAFVRGRGVAVTKCIIVNVWVFARGCSAWLGSSPGCFRRRCRGVVREDGPARALAGGRGRGGGLLSCVPRIQVL